jgi:hypothetical protein
MLRRKRGWLAAGFLVLLVGTPLALRYFPSRSVRSIQVTYPREWVNLGLKEDDDSVKALFDGEAGLATVSAPDRLEISRVGAIVANHNKTGSRTEVYPLVRGPIPVLEPTRSTIISALLSPQSYFWGMPKNCDPSYEICLSFYRATDRIDAFLCLGCRMILVVHNGRGIYVENFDFAQPALLRAIKTLLPSEYDLQAMNEDDDVLMNQLRDMKKRANTKE